MVSKYVALVAFGLSVGIAFGQETKVQFKDLPPAVQAAAKSQAEGATVKGYSKEIAKGKTEYEVQLLVKGKKRDVSIAPDGKVLETEELVAFSSIPQPAQEAIQQQAKSGKVVKVEMVKSDQPTVYEAVVRQNGKKREIRVLENGDKAASED